jgi:AcrR family transcriptional regulator
MDRIRRQAMRRHHVEGRAHDDPGTRASLARPALAGIMNQPGPRRRGEETRRSVLRAAEEVFAQVGYAGARMEDIAERSGIRRASFVHYYRDKPTLYGALLDDLFDGLDARYAAELAGPGSLTERMLRCIDVWAERIESRPSLLRITLWEMARAEASEPVPLASRVQPLVVRLSEAVREGQRQGVLRSDFDAIGFVMSVAGTTAFLGRRTALLGSAVSPPLQPGALAAELRSWMARVLFVD